MKSIRELAKEALKKPERKPPPHEVAACANLIEDKGLFTKKYARGYWQRLISKSEISFGEMEALLKEMNDVPSKYSRGGWLTNRLRERIKN